MHSFFDPCESNGSIQNYENVLKKNLKGLRIEWIIRAFHKTPLLKLVMILTRFPRFIGVLRETKESGKYSLTIIIIVNKITGLFTKGFAI